MPSASKQNIGVYCNPEHKLWVEESGPSVEDVRSGQALKEGEVTIAIKSTGICGYVFLIPKHGDEAFLTTWHLYVLIGLLLNHM